MLDQVRIAQTDRDGASGGTAGPLRVAHLVPATFGPGGVTGGAERYVAELARHMADVVPTTLVSFGSREREERVGALRVRVLRAAWHVRGQVTNPLASSMFGALASSNVVHCHQTHVMASTLAAGWCRLTGRRVFTTDLGGGGRDLSAYVSTDRWYHGHLHISQYSRRASDHDGRSWAHVILGGVDVGRFRPDPCVSREPRLLFVGRLLPHKGIDDLIEAVPADVRLDLIGPAVDGGYLRELEKLARGKPVTFRGECSDEELLRAYRTAAVVALPSVYRSRSGSTTAVPELLGQTLLEAMACEAPVVATDVASLPEVVEDGVTGVLVPPNDPARLREAIGELIRERGRAEAMGRAGRRRVLEKFSWPHVVERCLGIYAA